jgi:hypothetical protein
MVVRSLAFAGRRESQFAGHAQVDQQAVAGIKIQDDEFSAARDIGDSFSGERAAKSVGRLFGDGAGPAHGNAPDHGTRQTMRAQIAHNRLDFR